MIKNIRGFGSSNCRYDQAPALALKKVAII